MTIYDIAQEAGVSASTVSRVINKKKGVNKNNRILVEALLKTTAITVLSSTPASPTPPEKRASAPCFPAEWKPSF